MKAFIMYSEASTDDLARKTGNLVELSVSDKTRPVHEVITSEDFPISGLE